MWVTLVIGTKMRRRPKTSATSPSTRGWLVSERIATTTSRTLPTWSPSGSKIGRPTRRAAYTRPGLVEPDLAEPDGAAVLTGLNATVVALRFAVTTRCERHTFRLLCRRPRRPCPRRAVPPRGRGPPPTAQERSPWPSTSGRGPSDGRSRSPARSSCAPRCGVWGACSQRGRSRRSSWDRSWGRALPVRHPRPPPSWRSTGRTTERRTRRRREPAPRRRLAPGHPAQTCLPGHGWSAPHAPAGRRAGSQDQRPLAGPLHLHRGPVQHPRQPAHDRAGRLRVRARTARG